VVRNKAEDSLQIVRLYDVCAEVDEYALERFFRTLAVRENKVTREAAATFEPETKQGQPARGEASPPQTRPVCCQAA
jgi:hypothetical protein